MSAAAQTVAAGDCRVELVGGELLIANGQFERRWQLAAEQIIPTAFRLRPAGAEWIIAPPPSPPPAPAKLTGHGGQHGPTETASLLVEWGHHRFQVFSRATGVLMARTDKVTSSAAAAIQSTGIELDPSPTVARPAAAALETFTLARQHVRLIQVTLRDQTDIHNELVAESEWLLHPAEADLRLTGNLFILEDTLCGDGLIFLKLTALPHARPVQSGTDFRVCGGRDVTLLGGGPWVTLAYAGGRAGRTMALQTFQRQLRPYEPARDGLFLSNTWGDRSKDARLTEEFLLTEVAAGARLGVDVVQIDDGWQRGRSVNSVRAGGVWQGYWAADEHFWEPDPERFPNGLRPVIEAARRHKLRFGLWFGPDSSADFANWKRDAAKVLQLHRELGVDYFKIDGVKAPTELSEQNLRRFFDQVLTETAGRVVFDLDVTAEIRPGYFGLPHVGPIFVENRYTDWHRYWPHQTLRNFWRLAHYIDPLRLRMEWLNHERCREKYADDPLAPARYRPAYLFATTMFANPLGWFEVANLPAGYFTDAAPLIRLWKKHRAAIFAGQILPIGESPDGTAWTGFVSVAPDRRRGHVLLFRETNDRPQAVLAAPLFAAGAFRVTRLAGIGRLRLRDQELIGEIPQPREFLFAEVTACG